MLAALILGLRVKLRRTQHEHMFSALHLELGHWSTKSACLKRAKGRHQPEWACGQNQFGATA
jgi:hypothetical protein